MDDIDHVIEHFAGQPWIRADEEDFVHDLVRPGHFAKDAEGLGIVLFQLDHDGLAKEIAAEQHAVADFLFVEMPGEFDLGEGPAGLDPQHETEPGANGAMARGVPGKTILRPAGGVGREHEVK